MSGPQRSGPQSAARIFAWPLAIGVASVIGLVSALIGDGAYDVLSWLTLGGVTALIAFYLKR